MKEKNILQTIVTITIDSRLKRGKKQKPSGFYFLLFRVQSGT